MSVSTAPSSGTAEVGPIEEMGPIDFYAIEFPHQHFSGEALPYFVDLVDRGIVRLLDLVVIAKDNDGTVKRLTVVEAGPNLAVFEGATSGLLDDEDVVAAGEAIAPDSAAVLMVIENRWAAPFAMALRRGGAQLVASARLPVQAILAALDASESKA
jgi:hypothetical protein